MMNKYVETLTRKIQSKGPSYAQVDDLLVKVMVSPFTNTSRCF